MSLATLVHTSAFRQKDTFDMTSPARNLDFLHVTYIITLLRVNALFRSRLGLAHPCKIFFVSLRFVVHFYLTARYLWDFGSLGVGFAMDVFVWKIVILLFSLRVRDSLMVRVVSQTSIPK